MLDRQCLRIADAALGIARQQHVHGSDAQQDLGSEQDEEEEGEFEESSHFVERT
ncbi:MAG TPA: hypothetical protein VK928_01750 [Longimicrobiales bacterium]|nr:hypothetical protein [Longimicrobiales bacterium]